MPDNLDNSKDSLLEIFIIETNQLLEQLEEILLNSERDNKISAEDVEETFRIMHTIKGSATMMAFDNIASISHAVEDLFDFIRCNPDGDYSCVYDIALSSLDFIKSETNKIEGGKPADGSEKKLHEEINSLLESYKNAGGIEHEVKTDVKSGESNGKFNVSGEKKLSVSNKYRAKVFFDDGCLMENIRAFAIVYSLKDICGEIYYRPSNIADDNSSCAYIVENGFDIYFTTDESDDKINKLFENALCVKSFKLESTESFEDEIKDLKENPSEEMPENESDNDEEKHISKRSGLENTLNNSQNSLINVNITKLDKLLDLVGEIIIAESMVTKNPELEGLNLESFGKASHQLRKLVEELQDRVMSIRMVPIEPTFNKMHRIVRDMGKKLNKEVVLITNGVDTEVDKNVVNHLSDPLMHIIRNSMDHGIENPDERAKKGKPEKGHITLTASNTGGDVLITVADDGAGLDRKKILKKAKKQNLLTKPANELTDSDVFSLILHPGFSTKEKVTEYSGRGVGMDVVKNNVEKIGGRISIESQPEHGMTVYIRIPLTLTIIDGMKISVGDSIFTIPAISTREFFKVNKNDLLVDNKKNEMVLLRGKCYPILRLYKHFDIATDVTDLCDGIMTVVEMDGKSVCLFADRLIGEQQVVVKPLPYYLMQYHIKDKGIGGCTILGDGNISLIIDIKEIIGQVI